MTSPAQKAAGEIKLCPFCGDQYPLPRIGKRRAPKLGHDRYHWYVRHGWCGTEGAHGLTEQQAIDNWNKRDGVQQAITEAVDAAVAQERERYMKLAEKWRDMAHGEPEEPSSGYDKGHEDRLKICAKELESLVKEK